VPIMEFLPDNKVQDTSQYPRLKLELNERARILAIERAPHMEYIHRLEKPRIVNGVPEYHEEEKRDGTKQRVLTQDFIGTPICLGDLGIIEEKGVDPVNCPICAASVKGDMVAGPVRRFAMNVIRYALKPGQQGFALAEPYSVSCIAWAFGDAMFNKLTDFATEWGSLQQHDLLLGPCTVKQYQKFDVNVAATAEWLASEDRKRLTAETYKSSKAEDLAPLCGRKAKREYIESDLESIEMAWRVVHAHTAGGVPDLTGGDSAALAAGLDDLLADLPAAEHDATFRDLVATEPAEAAPVQVANQDLLDDLLAEPAAQSSAPSAAPSAETAPVGGDVGVQVETLSVQEADGISVPKPHGETIVEDEFEALLGDL